MNTKQLQKRINEIQEMLEQEVGSSTMDLINRLVELNIEIERECNK
jgi:hypothetical protein